MEKIVSSKLIICSIFSKIVTKKVKFINDVNKC